MKRYLEIAWPQIHKVLMRDVSRETLFKNASKGGWGRFLGVVKPTRGEWKALQDWARKYFSKLDPKEQASLKSLILFVQNCLKGNYDAMIDNTSDNRDELWDSLGVYPTEIYK